VSDHPPNADQGKSRSTPPLIRISLVLPRLDGGVECSALSARRRTPASRRMRSLMASGSRPDPLPRKSKLAPALLWVKGFRVEIVRPATSLLSLKLGPRSRGHPWFFDASSAAWKKDGIPAAGEAGRVRCGDCRAEGGAAGLSAPGDAIPGGVNATPRVGPILIRQTSGIRSPKS